MTRHFKRLSLLLALLATSLAAGPVLSLSPAGGALSGGPGETVAWTMTVTNDENYLVVISADYFTLVPVGTFTDLFSPIFEVVGLGSYATPSHSGLGLYTIDPSAPAGALSIGSIWVWYDLYSVSPLDPAFNPDTDGISYANMLEADASVSVVPEPSPGLMLGAGLAALGLGRAARRRRLERRR